MQLDSCRELKYSLVGRLPDLRGRPLDEEPHGWLALGIAPAVAGYRLAVRVAERAPVEDVVGRLAEQARDEIDVRTVGRVTALSAPPPEDLQKRQRPLVPGSSVGHLEVTAGTLGGFVRISEVWHVLSNNHVLGNSGLAQIGDVAVQPGTADGGADPDDRVGVLAAMSTLRSDESNLVDAALVRVDDEIEVDPEAYPGGGLGPIAEEPPDQDTVEKLGRTTGHTRGRITAFEVDELRISFPNGELVFDDQIEIAGEDGPFSGAGDSGSVIWGSANRATVGLLFAGSETGGPDGSGLTYANPMADVMAELTPTWTGDGS